jgi:hypothetical protein
VTALTVPMVAFWAKATRVRPQHPAVGARNRVAQRQSRARKAEREAAIAAGRPVEPVNRRDPRKWSWFAPEGRRARPLPPRAGATSGGKVISFDAHRRE